MSTLVGVHSISKAYGTQALFKDISFTICEGDRIGLIGPNGAGKSTLIEILMDLENPDEGSLSKRSGLRIGYASQMPEFPSLPVEEVLIQASSEKDPITAQTHARTLLSKAEFSDFGHNASALSGGWKKRLDIIRALMNEPQLLLLDEPTNHLDLEGIEWLENFLERLRTAYLVISHDRYFLEKVSNKIIELNKCYPKGLLIGEGSLSTFMEHKEDFLKAQKKNERGLASVVRNELDWLRTSPKARTTKSQSRIKRAYALMEQLSETKERNKTTKVGIDFQASDRETRKLIQAKNVSKTIGGKCLFKGVDIVLSPGKRLGIVGRNGTGKTTLLRILAKQMTPDMGTLKYADELKIVYFDQLREKIPLHLSLKEALSPNSDMVSYRGQSIHVNGWAKKFLFSPDRMGLPVNCLSGGERARIQIAKLMLEPADVLFLDEPTNDLDIPTLEIIEESLQEFEGAVVLITHDRCLMDRVCNQIIGLGTHTDDTLFASFDQWEQATLQQGSEGAAKVIKETAVAAPVKASSKRLTYQEQKELDQMEATITKLEAEIEAMQQVLEKPEVQADAKQSLEIYQSMAKLQERLEKLFERWDFLNQKLHG